MNEEKNTNAASTILAVVVLFALIGYGIYTRTFAPSDTTKENYTPISYATIVKQEEGAETPYSIDIEYPQFTGASKERDEKVNAHLEGLIEKTVAAFRKDVDALENASAASNLFIRYRVFEASYPLVSVELTSSVYMAGAAHPNHFVSALNWRLDTGSEVRLEDLFADNAEYLSVLSMLAREKLLAHPDLGNGFDRAWVEGGTSATSTNFENFVITKKGLVFFFNPYPVAAYAAGVLEVTLPKDELRGVANAAGPLYLLDSLPR